MKVSLELDGKDQINIQWNYPQIYDRDMQSTIEIDLIHTRASDGIRIKYDSERDGWVIEQPTILEWSGDDPICDPKWREAVFVPSWQFSESK